MLNIKKIQERAVKGMNTLNELVRKYLEENGISDKFFEQYIGCSQSLCSKWFKGERKLNNEQIQKTHEFLSGKHYKSVDEIMKGE